MSSVLRMSWQFITLALFHTLSFFLWYRKVTPVTNVVKDTWNNIHQSELLEKYCSNTYFLYFRHSIVNIAFSKAILVLHLLESFNAAGKCIYDLCTIRNVFRHSPAVRKRQNISISTTSSKPCRNVTLPISHSEILTAHIVHVPHAELPRLSTA